MIRVKSTDRKPTATGEYFGWWNGNEKCTIHVAGGEVFKIKFSNNAQFSSDFRDLSKEVYDWLDESPAASPVSDAVDMELVKGCVKRLADLMKYHINPYNLGEQGEVGSLITTLAQLFKLPPPSSPTPTNVQEQEEDNQSDSSRIAEYEDWEEKNNAKEQDELWEGVANVFGFKCMQPEIQELKSKYTITKKQ